MRVLLDTQAFIELARQGLPGVSSRARRLVEDEGNELLLSAVSITEIAIKTNLQKLTITAADTLKAAEDMRLVLVPFEPRHAMRLFDLPLHHRDPFDRMLIATALSEDIPLISQDGEFKKYRRLNVIW